MIRLYGCWSRFICITEWLLPKHCHLCDRKSAVGHSNTDVMWLSLCDTCLPGPYTTIWTTQRDTHRLAGSLAVNSLNNGNSNQLLKWLSSGCCGWIMFSGSVKALLLLIVAHQFSVNTKLLYKLCQWGSRVRGQLVKVKDGLLAGRAPLVD